MSDSWAPEEQERSSSTGRFANPKNWLEVKEGKRTYQKFRFRVLGPAVSGMVAWSADNKPFRFRSEKDIPADFNWRLRDDGFTRVSFGMQSTAQHVLAVL